MAAIGDSSRQCRNQCVALHLPSQRLSAPSDMESTMRIIATSLIVTAAFLGLSVSRANAQTLVIANVPFEFMVGTQHFPAGRYDVRQAGESIDLLAIQGEYNHSMALSFAHLTFSGDPAGNRPALVFTHRGNEYRLSEVWQSGTEGMTLLNSGHEPERSHAGARGDGSELAYVIAETL
jgi:hypothetical protein